MIHFNAKRSVPSIQVESSTKGSPFDNCTEKSSYLPTIYSHEDIPRSTVFPVEKPWNDVQNSCNDSDLLAIENWRGKAEAGEKHEDNDFLFYLNDHEISNFIESSTNNIEDLIGTSTNNIEDLIGTSTLPEFPANLQDYAESEKLDEKMSNWDDSKNSLNFLESVTEVVDIAKQDFSPMNISFDDHSYCATNRSVNSNNDNVECHTRFVISDSSTINADSEIVLHLNKKQKCSTDELLQPVSKFREQDQPSKPESKKKLSKFFKACPEIQHRNTLVALRKKPTLLPHGSRCLPMKIKENHGEIRSYSVSNTCSFDALVRTLMTAAIDDVNYFKFLKSSENCTLKLVCNLIENGATKAILQERVRILKNLRPYEPHVQTTQRVVSYDVNGMDTIANMANKTLNSEPSVENTENCSDCRGRTYVTTILGVNHKIIARHGFGYLSKALDFHSPIFRISCRAPCKGRYTWLRKPRNHIVIELDIRSDIKSTSEIPCCLQQMATRLKLQDDESSSEYRLTGIISFVPSGIGHYIAYCLRSNGIWEIYDDLAKEIRTCRANTKIIPHLAVYIRC